VALKLISGRVRRDEETRDRFWREARAAAAVNHPNVCQIYEVGEEGEELFLAMELLQGESLEKRFGRGPLEFTEALRVGLEILAALEAVHRQGLVHRDLKPSNVFLTRAGVKLLDFGLARSFDRSSAAGSDVTRAGQIVGTPRYMSPEQLRGEPLLDARADLFAFGAILYEMLSGRRAFDAPSEAELINQILQENPPALVGAPAVVAVDRVIRRAVAKRRDDRPPSAETMARELRAIPAGETGGFAVRPHVLTRLIVLPFRVLRPDPEFDFLGVSLPDAITSSLSGLGSLLVRSTMTATRFAADSPDVRRIASETDVDLVLTGTVLRAADKVRVTAQLVEAPAGTVLWSHGAVVDLGDVFHLEEELVRRIVGSLSVPLTAREDRLLGRDVPRSPRAYELYLRANEQGMRSEGWSAARQLYLDCLREDDRFAPAWARLGRVYRVLAKYQIGDPEAPANRAKAEDAFRRALELNPDLSLAHNLYASFEVDAGRARAALGRLLARARGGADPEVYAGLVTVTRYCGLLDASVVAHEQARRLDPTARTSVSYTHLLLGEYQKALETDVDVFPFMPVYALLFQDRLAEAHALLKSLQEKAAGPVMQVVAAWTGLLDGHVDEALAATRRLLESFPDPEGIFVMSKLFMAGDRPDEAIDFLARAVSGGFHCASAFRLPAFDSLHGDTRFEELVTEVSKKHEEAVAVYVSAGGPDILGGPHLEPTLASP
jgi:TolB-like protein